MKMVELKQWGLTERFRAEASQYANLYPARVTEQHRDQYTVVSATGSDKALVSGKFIHQTESSVDYPAVGDWVMVSHEADFAVIHHVLERFSCVGRKAAGRAHETQIIASNIDKIYICMALDRDFNLRRLERYLALAWDSGVVPVVVLTKSDVCDHLAQKLSQISGVVLGSLVMVTSNVGEDGYSAIATSIAPNQTIAFIGSSGVGKSTIINYLLGTDAMATKDVRDDGKGRHTTTHRQMMLLRVAGL